MVLERPQRRILKEVLRIGQLALTKPDRGAVQGAEILAQQLLEGMIRRTTPGRFQDGSSDVRKEIVMLWMLDTSEGGFLRRRTSASRHMHRGPWSQRRLTLPAVDLF
jgi:hypothetical protein